jgi:hypothetical protein
MLRAWTRRYRSHEVVQEVLISILVAGLGDVVLGHDVVVRMITLPCLFLPLLSYSCFLLALK